jgi:hypothetical protein
MRSRTVDFAARSRASAAFGVEGLDVLDGRSGEISVVESSMVR